MDKYYLKLTIDELSEADKHINNALAFLREADDNTNHAIYYRIKRSLFRRIKRCIEICLTYLA